MVNHYAIDKGLKTFQQEVGQESNPESQWFGASLLPTAKICPLFWLKHLQTLFSYKFVNMVSHLQIIFL